jgi:transcriptional regulator with GAF, ATPase, and Fis domain
VRAHISASTEQAFGFPAAQYAERVESATPSEPRLRALLEAGMALASDLSLESLLQRLTELAAELTGARYAALGVIDPSGSRLERFVTHGVDEELRAAIGDPPHGRGILGALITDARPLRLHAIAEDPRSVGFPPNHPPMSTFLGVPVCCAVSPTGTSTSPRRKVTPTSRMPTRSSSSCSPPRPRWQSRTPACTSRRRAGRDSSSRSSR